MSKSESARITGAKSHGPTIEAGLRRSFQNALKHGFSAQTIVLPTEDASEFNQLLAAYTNQFQPDGPVELDLVHQMVAANWRLRRLSTIETQLFTNAIEHEEERAADRDDDEDDQPSPRRIPHRSLQRSRQLTRPRLSPPHRIPPRALLLGRPPRPAPTPTAPPVAHQSSAAARK